MAGVERGAPDGDDFVYVVGEKAFAQYALADHTGGAEQDDFHGKDDRSGRMKGGDEPLSRSVRDNEDNGHPLALQVDMDAAGVSRAASMRLAPLSSCVCISADELSCGLPSSRRAWRSAFWQWSSWQWTVWLLSWRPVSWPFWRLF